MYFLPITLPLWSFVLWLYRDKGKDALVQLALGALFGIGLSVIFYFINHLHGIFTYLLLISPLALYPPFINPFVLKSIWPTLIHVPFYSILFFYLHNFFIKKKK